MSPFHYATLSIAYGAVTALFILAGEYAHAGCTLVASAVYADAARKPQH